MRDRLHIRGAVAVFDEEALVIFESVGGAGDDVIQAVGVVVLGLLARALLHVGGGDDAEVCL